MSKRVNIELVEPLSKRVQRRVLDVKYLLLGLTSPWWLGRFDTAISEELKVFCCFVGHGRSGGTLVGALLNAHPNIALSNELNALRRLRMGLTAQQLFRVIYKVSQRQVARGSMGGGGYSYRVPGQWQGRHRALRVIGDRKAGATAFEIARYPDLLTILKSKVSLKKQFIHVIRNPFDTIATTYQKTLPGIEVDPNEHLSREIHNYFARDRAVWEIERMFGTPAIHHLHHERLIADPGTQLQRLCEFLGVEAFPDYLQACASIVRKSPHQSRRSIAWTNQHISAINQGIKECHWLADYELT